MERNLKVFAPILFKFIRQKMKNENLNLTVGNARSSAVVVCGGGTGGHLAIAKALNEELVARGERTIF
ncbi:MAG: hypothetical protein D8H92_00160, partial [Campylobacter sp.]